MPYNGFELIQRPPYWPDLALSSFQYFQNRKKAISGTHLWSDEDGMDTVKDLLNGPAQEANKYWFDVRN